ncbi:MAG: hypothetical protein HZA53_06220 [Planctomycetes bacterium]|nr:hypothetical protein [Planctomycetota bacterium]
MSTSNREPRRWTRRIAVIGSLLGAAGIASAGPIVEELRDDHHTDGQGPALFDLWNATGKGAPIRTARAEIALTPFLHGDVDGNCVVGRGDQALVLASFGKRWNEAGFEPRADLDGDHPIGVRGGLLLLGRLGAQCP